MRKFEGRIDAIDFLRGFAILEMTAAHFAGYFPIVIEKIINYLETAMALFVLLAGFMVGWRYFAKYREDSGKTTLQLWKRALQLIAIQYMIIATVNVPLFLMGRFADRGEPFRIFLLESVTFSNQIGIVHILPTFIPLFLISPLILRLLATKMHWLLVAGSAGLFIIGNISPHLLDYGEPVIFPFLVIQIYFVIGCIWGRAAYHGGDIPPRALSRWLSLSCAALIISLYLLHGKVIPGRYYSLHPLNIFGLLYHVPIIATIILGALKYWPILRKAPFAGAIRLLGRHALLAFVLHLYFAMAIGSINYYVALPFYIAYALILISLVLSVIILRLYEKQNAGRPGPWARAMNMLFR